jgi:signal peptidase I
MPTTTQSANPYYVGKIKKPLYKRIFILVFKSGFNLIQFFVIVMTLLVFLYLFVLTPHIVDGRSMQPNFCNGDIYFTYKLGGLFKPYQHEDVITFKHDESNDYIKRVIGIPGDKIRVEGGKVYRNGELLNEEYLPEGRQTLLNPGDSLYEGSNFVVPEGRYFVMGDNRPHSTDSRYFLSIDPKGFNPIDGKVVLVLWPPKRIRIFDEKNVKPLHECTGTLPNADDP